MGDEAEADANGTPDRPPETPVSRGTSFSQRLARRMSMDSLDLEAMRIQGMSNRGQQLLPLSMVLRLAYQSIGVVYGDLGTSPLYVFSSTFTNGIRHSEDVLGALSLIIYTLTLLPLVKYVFIVLRANDNGEGGTFALYSLLCRHAKISLIPNYEPTDSELSQYRLQLPTGSRQQALAQKLKDKIEQSHVLKTAILILVLLGTACVIGDGVLTPSISVLSAIQGIKNATPKFNQTVVVVVSSVILALLFSLQRIGTSKVGFLFAPVVLLWFLCIAILGLYNIIKHDPTVLKALSPHHIFKYFIRNKEEAWVSLGGIVLCVTGTEAMYADLGHFSVRSIQIAFTTLVYPCLLLAYIGQGAYLQKYPADVVDAFYKSIPDPVYWPMFLVATAAAMIASQAMISAVFSIIKQAMAMACFPRVKIVHTSERFPGQIYIPEINWLLMILCLAITIGFRDTSKIGHAYGIAVVAVMLVTTVLLTLIMLLIWQTHLSCAIGFLLIFGLVETTYFSSMLSKIAEGGWVPLAFTGFFLLVMYSWHYGQRSKYEYEVLHRVHMDWIQALGTTLGAVRLPGIGLVYSDYVHGVPVIFTHLLKNLPAMHSIICFVTIKYLHVPRVTDDERFLVRRVGTKDFRMYRCAVRYGYTETRKGADDFQNQLIASLANFICREALIANQPQVPVATPAASPPRSPSTQEITDSGETGIDCTDAESNLDGSVRSTAAGRMSSDKVEGDPVVGVLPGGFLQVCGHRDPRLEDDIRFLYKAKEAGVVYLLGHTHVKANKRASVAKRFVINYLYSFLKRNCRESGAALMIPHECLVEVGLIYDV